MAAAGIDLGGTKIEARVFDDTWVEVARRRVPTPDRYEDLLSAIEALASFADTVAGCKVPLGVGSAGVFDPQGGPAVAANLAVNGHPFGADLTGRLRRPVSLMNDAVASALSEAVFGAGRGADVVVGLSLGTGVGGGVVRHRRPDEGALGVAGEVGHMAAAAHVIVDAGLPVFACGCGRRGCVEAYVSGPGLARMALHLTGEELTPEEVAAQRQGAMSTVWTCWCDLTAALIRQITLTVDPDIIVLAGGLSRVDGVLGDLRSAGAEDVFEGVRPARLALAEGGDASAARGAAYAALQAGGAL